MPVALVRATVCALACALIGASASTHALAQSVAVGVRTERPLAAAAVTMDVTNLKLERALQIIAQQAGLRLFFTGDGVPSSAFVTMHVREMPATEAFAKALVGTGLKATIHAGDVVLTSLGSPTTAVAQGSLAGTVLEAKTKRPLRGVRLTLDATGKGVTTGNDGTFRFSVVAPGPHTLNARLLGYRKAATTVTAVEGQTVSIDMTLEPSVNALDQVVVTSTIIPTELKAIPSALTVITAAQIEARGITRIDQLFRGDVPGLFAPNLGSFSALDSVVMFSRGATALSTSSAGTRDGTNPIKTYVDGIELVNPSYLSQIDPRSIERIEILTGPQASTIYGSNALNGVMQIFTKRGHTTRPQLNLQLTSGIVQNNYNAALAPEHAADAQVSGVEGQWSYNANGSIDYAGSWTPGKQTTRYSGSGGGRMLQGPLTVDLSLRQALTRNVQHGYLNYGFVAMFGADGFAPDNSVGVMQQYLSTLTGQTGGITIGYTPFSWWSHELLIGSDRSTTEQVRPAAHYSNPVDSTISISQTSNLRTSQRYTTTAKIPVASLAALTVTLGADHWRTSGTSWDGGGLSLIGSLASPSVTRTKPEKNTGGFFQGQVGVWDALFVTYGLRAEWNPNYGADVQPNLAPRYGVAYTRDLGPVTTKWRASYGRSTRPPAGALKQSVPVTAATTLARYGQYDSRIANPELGPEFQQGGEGGVELYLGNRGSLVVTRYNQTVDGLITNVNGIDSVRSLQLGGAGATSACTIASDGYCYARQTQYLNIGSIRNQGWELQGSVTTGPFTTHATYSWTKSRIIGITPTYRHLLSSALYAVGKSFSLLAEHTWALNVSYAKANTTVAVSVNGTGQLYREADDFSYGWYQTNYQRFSTNVARYYLVEGYQPVGLGYAMADLNASHRFTASLEATLQVQNLTNYYRNDRSVQYVTPGRESKIGFRWRL